MIQIGEGLQYRVYALDETRVLKRPKSRLDKMITLHRWGHHNPLNNWSRIKQVDQAWHRSLDGLGKRLSAVDLATLGDPEFSENGVYAQDRAKPVGHFLPGRREDQTRAAINALADAMIALWRAGIADKGYNFGRNWVRREDGSVFLADLGELVYDPAAIARGVERRDWSTAWSMRAVADARQRETITHCLNDRLTPDVFASNWATDTNPPSSAQVQKKPSATRAKHPIP